MERANSLPTSENQHNMAVQERLANGNQQRPQPPVDQYRQNPATDRRYSDTRPTNQEQMMSAGGGGRGGRGAGGPQQIMNPAANDGAQYSTSAGRGGRTGGGDVAVAGGRSGSIGSGGPAGRENPYSTRPLPSPPTSQPTSPAPPGYSTSNSR